MLDTPAQSYIYEQYADDQDLQAFVESYNAAQLTIQQWFWQNILGYWPILTGDILAWCGLGIYGLAKTAIAGPPTQALGPLNTEELNTATLNSFVPVMQVVYQLTDDMYQRILTWHLYRADGRHFTVRWLKRRIMRFLLGTNGLDPQPELPGFTIGCENTEAISVAFDNGICTVTINQTLLGLFAQLAPNILTIFSAAFTNGSLELPLEFTYEVDVTSPFAAIVVPPSIFGAGIEPMIQAGPATVLAAGNVGPLTYAWSWVSVDGQAVSSNPPGIVVDSSGLVVWDSSVGINIDEPTAAVTTFTANDMAVGETRTGVASCVVTDTGTGTAITLMVPVTIEYL